MRILQYLNNFYNLMAKSHVEETGIFHFSWLGMKLKYALGIVFNN